MIKPQRQRRVVITGLGVVSSIGIGWPTFWKNLLAGKSGISSYIAAFDTSHHDRHFAGEIKNFTGIDAPYEAPSSPEIITPTGDKSVEECTTVVVEYLKKRGILDI